jgi:hypothetical protein
MPDTLRRRAVRTMSARDLATSRSTLPRHTCAMCVELQRFAIRRRDVRLIVAAESLSAEHLANDRERIAFATACRSDRASRAAAQFVHENGPSRRQR